MPRSKSFKATSVRFDSVTEQLVKKLAKKFGINQSSVVIMSIRKLAQVEGVV